MITAFERLVRHDVSKVESSPMPVWNNLSLELKRAIDSLSSDQSIIIREADKGGAVVLLDREVYISEALRQLDNPMFYQEIQEDPSGNIKKLIQTVLIEILNHGYISENVMKALTKQEYRIPIFYVLPKVHKPGFPPPSRSIISGFDSLLDPLLKYLDHFLQPLVTKIPTYLKDTQDLIRRIEDISIPTGAVLLSLDVAALYTNITHSESYRILAFCLDKRDDPYPPTHFLLEILELILEKNYFKFMDRFFLQIKGVAMGSATAPSIANLFMSAFETEYILNVSNPFAQYILFF